MFNFPHTGSPGIEHSIIRVGALPVHLVTAGKGMPVVLIHGDGGSAGDWAWILPLLGTGYRIHALDLPGSGATPPSPGGYAPEALSRLVADVLDALEIREAVLVGHSAGGLLAALVASSRLELVRALVLVDTAGLGRFLNPVLAAQGFPGAGPILELWGKSPLGSAQMSWLRARLLFASPSRAPREWFDYQRRLGATPGYFHAMSASVRDDLWFGMQRVVLHQVLGHLPIPIQIVWGERDIVVPVHQAYRAASRLPTARLDIIPDAGHAPQIEQPDRAAAALFSFLDEALVELRANEEVSHAP